MRNILSTALVALVVGSIAGATVSALAQSEPAPGTGVELAGVNADTVDGRHAVGAGARPQQRKNKLVATNAQGLLPANIVKPPWDRITGKPAAFANGQIDWGEVQGIPAGFADGVDNAGVTKVTLTRVSNSQSVEANTPRLISASCPAGSKVTGGGFVDVDSPTRLIDSYPNPTSTGWTIYVYAGGSNDTVAAFAMCLSTTPAGGLAVASKGVEPAFVKKRN